MKRFLLGQAHEQVSWYRQSIEALDFVGCVACRRSLETGQSFLEHYLPAYNFRETERVTHLAAKNRIRPRVCYAILHEIEQSGDYEVTWALRMTDVPILFGFREPNLRGNFSENQGRI